MNGSEANLYNVKHRKKEKKMKKYSQSAGFEPARAEPNRFLVYRLNHSATTAVVLACSLRVSDITKYKYFFNNI